MKKVQPVDPLAEPFELHGVMKNAVSFTKEPVEVVTWQMSTQTEDVQIIDQETQKAVNIEDVAVDPLTWQ